MTKYQVAGKLALVNIDQCPISLAEKIVNEARGRLEGVRRELDDLVDRAQADYDATLSELETMAAISGEAKEESLASRLAMLGRTKLLHQTAAEFDAGMERLNRVVGYLEDALAVLEGKVGRGGLVREKAEVSLEAVVIQAQEEERYRLAREIHDGPAQILANVALQLEYISKLAPRDPLRAKEEMDTIQKDLRLAVGEVRRFMYDLRPPALGQHGVGPAVESHCQRLGQRFGLKIEVHWRSGSNLPPAHETAVFRVVQEALQNVVKHAEATEVKVLAVEKDGSLEVAVTDNGKGFDPSGVLRLDPQHFGLAGIRARAQQIGADVEVASSLDQGTTILLRIPLNRP